MGIVVDSTLRWLAKRNLRTAVAVNAAILTVDEDQVVAQHGHLEEIELAEQPYLPDYGIRKPPTPNAREFSILVAPTKS